MEDKTNECCIQTNNIYFFLYYTEGNKETAIFQSNPTASPHSFTLVHELLEDICKQFFHSRAKPRMDRVLDLFTVCK